MKFNLFVFAILAMFLVLLSGCATAQSASPSVTLQQLSQEDLSTAIDQAKTDNDVVALQCWQAINDNLGAINKPLPVVKGIASGIQAKRSIKSRLDAGLPPAIVSGCATLYVQEHFGVMTDIMKFIGLAK